MQTHFAKSFLHEAHFRVSALTNRYMIGVANKALHYRISEADLHIQNYPTKR